MIAWSGIVSLVSLKLIDAAIGLRATEDEEVQGLDLSHHDEAGYRL